MLEIGVDLHAIDENAPALMFFQPIDAADECGFSRAGRSANDDAFAALDLESYIPQRMEIPVPFMHADHFHRDGVSCGTQTGVAHVIGCHHRRSYCSRRSR